MARGSINHIALTVSDLAAAEAAFYGPLLTALGYDKVEEEAGRMTVWFNPRSGAAINLWQASDALKDRKHERYAPGFHHCAFAVESRDDVEEIYDVLLANGIRVLDDPAEYPHYAPGYYAVYFEDPDGLKFEAVHMPVIPD
jgi:glyoxylase I family protein